jgi:hypothetical protein
MCIRRCSIILRPQLILIFFITSLPIYADDKPNDAAESLGNSWHILVGAGSSQPGWGDTKEKVETTDIILRHKRPQAKTRGKDWYINRKSVLVEIPLTLLREPDEPAMIGFTMNVNWTFIKHPKVQPFLLIGGGPVYTKAKIPGTSSSLKGSYQVGIGFDYSLGKAGMSFEWRYHHLSNGSIKEPNDPLNSSKFLLGYKFPF